MFYGEIMSCLGGGVKKVTVAHLIHSAVIVFYILCVHTYMLLIYIHVVVHMVYVGQLSVGSPVVDLVPACMRLSVLSCLVTLAVF